MQKSSMPLLMLALCSSLYLGYLALTSSMVIVHDSVGYEKLGELIRDKGWVSYFVTGPNREPIYPWLISISMKLGGAYHISYQDILKWIHIGCVLSTQILLWHLMDKLNLRLWVRILCVGYLAVSPAMVNSTLSLYSEVITYPVIGLILLSASRCIESLKSAQTKRIVLDAASLAGLLVVMTFMKSIFEFVAIFFFLFLIVFVAIKAKHPSFRQALLWFSIVWCAVYFIPITGYKMANQVFNGNFLLTDRGAWALYGNTARRMEPLTLARLGAAMTYAADDHLCNYFFGEKNCVFWAPVTSDDYGYPKMHELTKQHVPMAQANHILLNLSIEKALHNPFQYALLTAVEGIKMFFWESMRIGFVIYPRWLTQVYALEPVNIVWEIILAGLTLLSFLLAVPNCRKMLATQPAAGALLCLTLTLIGALTFFYSFFCILKRYSFTLVPLYLLLIAWFINRIVDRKAKVPS